MSPRTKTVTKKPTKALGKPSTAAKQEIQVQIPAIERNVFKVKIRGKTPLICHPFSEKAQKQIADRQKGPGSVRKKKSARDPKAEYLATLTKTPKGKGYMFKVSAVKAACVTSCRFIEGVNMTYARGAFFIRGDVNDEYFEIKKSKPKMRTDGVRLQGSATDLRYRAMFDAGWEGELHIEHDPSVISMASIVNLLNRGGFHIGIGEMRPEQGKGNHSCGRFEVISK